MGWNDDTDDVVEEIRQVVQGAQLPHSARDTEEDLASLLESTDEVREVVSQTLQEGLAPLKVLVGSLETLMRRAIRVSKAMSM